MKAKIEKDNKWTYQRMADELTEDVLAEIINNELYISLTPNTEHQRVSRKLERILIDFVEQRQLGEIFDAPFDVILDKNNVVQPDILYISNENAKVVTKKCVEGTPDLVIEIISPSSYYRDQVEKKDLYERFGVKEYWIVDPANQVIEIFALEKGKYQLLAFIAEEGAVQSKLLEGLEINIKDIIS